jgi:large subunit ribosomal protein L4
METKLYNQKGKEAGMLTIPDAIFGLKWNPDLVHQVTEAMRINRRAGTANAKDRSEVRGGGKKPWKQKGTGRARHASIRSPIWSGGGVTHGPLKDRNYSRKINKKMRGKALAVVLAEKYRNGEILFVDALEFKGPKTKEAALMVSSFATIKGFEKILAPKKKNTIIAIPDKDEALMKSFRNLKATEVELGGNLNPLALLERRYLIMVNPDAQLKMLSKKLS